MNGGEPKEHSRTDWARIDAMPDDEIDTSDIPELGEDFFATAEIRTPTNIKSATASVDADINQDQ